MPYIGRVENRQNETKALPSDFSSLPQLTPGMNEPVAGIGKFCEIRSTLYALRVATYQCRAVSPTSAKSGRAPSEWPLRRGNLLALYRSVWFASEVNWPE